MKRKLLCLLANLVLITVFAQKENKIANQVIVQLDNLTPISEVVGRFNQVQRASQQVTLVRSIDEDFRFYLLEISNPSQNEDEVLYALRSQRGVLEASFNHIAKPRNTTPNDSLFARQWNILRIQADKVWDFTKGGKTACGDDIVVAVVEPGYGFNTKHEDIVPNLFVNKNEIDKDGIDNDGNGYIDDIYGINALTLKGNLSGDPLSHGTAVAGIIGAKGDNKTGVSGINWNVKLMLISNAGNESEILAAYAYVIKMRKLYNESNGKKGAYIVATNYSGGIDKTFESAVPLWCGMYNQLGEVGILTAGAGPNSNINVDVNGDIPTTCSSKYLIAVTNSDRADVKVQNAGFGTTNIDLAAPGGSSGNPQNIGSFTVKPDATPNKGYGEFTGTSAATPHVAGSIALLYSISDTAFCNAAKRNPSQTALFVKDLILENVDKTDALKTQTLSGGRLNVWRAFDALRSALKPVQVSNLNVYPNPVRETLYFDVSSLNGKTQTYYIYNALGQLILEKTYTPKPFASNRVKIEVGNLAQGVYTLSTRTDDNTLVSKKFVVNR
jgi:subtilisin family serine protease